MLLALTLSAWADSITLDSGAIIEGDLARYEFGGDCQISVTEGQLSGVILIVPCHRVESFVRTTVRVPVPIGVADAPVVRPPPSEVVRPGPADVPFVAVVDAPAASQPVEETALDAPDAPADEAPVTEAPAAESPETETSAAAVPAAAPAAAAPSEGPAVAAEDEDAPAAPRAAPTMGAIGAPAAEAPPPTRKPVSF